MRAYKSKSISMSHGEDFGNDPAEKFVSDLEKKVDELHRRGHDAREGDAGKTNLQELRRVEDAAHGVVLNIGPRLETPSNRISSEQLQRLRKVYDDAKSIKVTALEAFMDKAATALGLPEVD